MLNLLFQPPEHLCSERRAVHSQAEPSLLGIICYKTQFSLIPEGIFFLYKVQARVLEGKHIYWGGKRVEVFFLAVWIVRYLSKNIIHGRYDFADFSLEKIKLSLPFSKGTQFIKKKLKKEKCVFIPSKSTYMAYLFLKMDGPAPMCKIASLISICLTWTTAHQKTFFQVHAWGFGHSHWYHFNPIWLSRK